MSIKLLDKPKRGFEMGGRFHQDPIGSEKARGKSAHRRKSGRDPGLTPTENARKAKFLKQFTKLEGSVNSEAYRNAECWCDCPFGGLRGENGKCSRCG